MSSLNDTKSNDWQKSITNRSAVIFSDEDVVGQLLASQEIDYLNMPEITTKPQAFNNFEQLVDIRINDNLPDPSAFAAPIDELPTADRSEPVPCIEKTKLDGLPPTSGAEDASNVCGADKNASPISSASETGQGSKPISINLLDFHVANSRTAVDKPGNIGSLRTFTGNPELPVENTSSLVDNYTSVENIASDNDFLLPGVAEPTQITPVESKAHQTVRTDSDKPILVSVTSDSSTNETGLDSALALYKAEQEKSQLQMQNRITQLEKSLRIATLFSLVAALLSGVALIAAVSGLV